MAGSSQQVQCAVGTPCPQWGQAQGPGGGHGGVLTVAAALCQVPARMPMSSDIWIPQTRGRTGATPRVAVPVRSLGTGQGKAAQGRQQ